MFRLSLMKFLLVAVVALTASAVQAQSLEDPFNNDWSHPCEDAATPDECMQYETGASPAPGMVTCRSTSGCKACFEDERNREAAVRHDLRTERLLHV